jgi:N-acyl homoserine lactone hydrolase
MTATVHAIPLAKILGRAEMAKFTYLKGFGQNVEFGYYAWLVRDGEHNILIDAGATADQAINAWGRPPETVEHVQTLSEGLARHGLGVDDIDIAILTHLHMDHIAYVYDLPRAKKYVQRKEWDFASQPQPIDRYYDAEFIKDLEFEFIDGDQVITENVDVLFTPGHTPGGQSVRIRTERGSCIITGFCCVHENFGGQCACCGDEPTFTIPGIHQNSMDAYNSMRKVWASADFVVANHDARYIRDSKVS